MMLKNSAFLCAAIIALSTGCSSTDVGTKLADYGEGGLASAQVVSGKTILMSPRLEDVTPDSFNIRYVEFSFGYGTPMNVRDMAIAQCESVGKVAIYKASSRGLVQGNTVKAYYECRSQD
ncbi:MAG: hypothetical protein HOI67_01100 [Gammaproteobacteria bacterium]|jgi:hypothetical protein|nr:hypothetical protein [Gammaproteobacteria bacterium]